MIDKAATFTKQWEGCRLEAYQDLGGVWTIGYGETQEVVGGMQILETDALIFLKRGLGASLHAVRRLTKVSLKENQLIALMDFVYNLGAGSFQRSTLRQKINRGEFEGIEKEFMKWNKVKGRSLRGLTRRRAAEAELLILK